eukprot:7041683-Prymnesium_polylepis.1
MVLSRRASSRSIAPTGDGRAAAGGSQLESLLDSQLGLESCQGPGKGPSLILREKLSEERTSFTSRPDR